jgi:hypothetical protein
VPNFGNVECFDQNLASKFDEPNNFQKGILTPILQVPQIFHELGSRKLGKMGKLTCIVVMKSSSCANSSGQHPSSNLDTRKEG